MRKFMPFRLVAIAGLATLFVAGVLQAAVPLPGQSAARLCMFEVPCSECVQTCFAWNPHTERVECPAPNCCNCYL